jgi:hypothetical protein
MKLRLSQEDPSPRAIDAQIKGPAKDRAKAESRTRVAWSGPGMCHKLTEQDLRDEGLGNSEQVVVGRGAP